MKLQLHMWNSKMKMTTANTNILHNSKSLSDDFKGYHHENNINSWLWVDLLNTSICYYTTYTFVILKN
jgi:hypothetical protein